MLSKDYLAMMGLEVMGYKEREVVKVNGWAAWRNTNLSVIDRFTGLSWVCYAHWSRSVEANPQTPTYHEYSKYWAKSMSRKINENMSADDPLFGCIPIINKNDASCCLPIGRTEWRGS